MEELKVKDAIKFITGASKNWLIKEAKQQEKIGNYGCISFKIGIDSCGKKIEVGIGKSWGVFRQVKYGDKKGQWQRDNGNLYCEEQVTKLVNELAINYPW